MTAAWMDEADYDYALRQAEAEEFDNGTCDCGHDDDSHGAEGFCVGCGCKRGES